LRPGDLAELTPQQMFAAYDQIPKK